MNHFELTEKRASFLLAAVIIARATGYLFSKICMEYMGMFTLLAIRSLLAVMLLLATIALYAKE